MTARICPEHEDLMRELACGLLDDARAARAEGLRVECSHCASWWKETFAGEAFDQVDNAVVAAFASLNRPARRRYGWLAAAAALVLTIGIGSTSLFLRETGTEFSRAATPVPSGPVLTVMDFESGSLSEVTVAPMDSGAVPSDNREAVFQSNLESGDLSSWSSHS